jgi:hypothetical protein
MTKECTAGRWASAWPDAAAFALGLGVARIAGWTTADLVWSLWLSSVVVGYATIVWTIVRPGVDIARGAWRERAFTAEVLRHRDATAAGASILVVGGLFLLAFFTIHFGGFHYVHSQFVIAFFPLDGTEAGRAGTAGMSTYVEVARRYWQFLPSAFLAERAGFLRQPALVRPDVSVTANRCAQGGERRKARRDVLRTLSECGAHAPADLLLRFRAFCASGHLRGVHRRLRRVLLSVATATRQGRSGASG